MTGDSKVITHADDNDSNVNICSKVITHKYSLCFSLRSPHNRGNIDIIGMTTQLDDLCSKN